MPTYDPGPTQLTAPASVFVVVKLDRAKTGKKRFKLMPNVVVEAIGRREGAAPHEAQFSYILDDTNPATPFPYLWEQLFPLDATGPYVVEVDDELVVYEYLADGSREIVFDGFALAPQVDAGHGLAVTFAARSAHVRLWDQPIKGAYYRDCDEPQTGDPVFGTGLAVWFNPNQQPNKTPKGHDQDQGETDDKGNDISCPLFLDALMPQTPGEDPVTPDFWDLGSFVRYLFRKYNTAKDAKGKLYVNDPLPVNGATLDEYLVTVTPAEDAEFMDLADDTTFDTAPIIIRSYDVTGKTLPEAVDEQLGYYGFHMYMETREDPADPGMPQNNVILFRTDGLDGNAPKKLWYPQDGASIADGVPDFATNALARDATDAPNEYEIETKEVEYEAGFCLAPGFTIASADASNIPTFDESALAAPGVTADQRRKYRVFVFDEAGFGHWNFAGTPPAFVAGTATSLDKVLGAPDPQDDGTTVRRYAHRPRPGDSPLFSKDDQGKPRPAELELSRDYAGPVPGVWDGTGTWQSLADSGWKLLKDSLGIEINADNPETWKIPEGTVAAFAGNVVNAVTSLAAPAGANTKFTLKLTCVIKGDRSIEAVAAKRDASPRKFAIRRLIDSKDHWQRDVVDKSSKYKSGTDWRDDTDAAQAHAEALREATEMPPLAGPLTIPTISHAFEVGDLISRISGRDVRFDTGAGVPAGELGRYPCVMAVTWTCQNPQSTTLNLADTRTEPEGASHGWGRSR